MNQTKILLAVVELAKVGSTLSAEDAISRISILIDRLDPLDQAYERDVEALMRIGATIWDLAQHRK